MKTRIGGLALGTALLFVAPAHAGEARPGWSDAALGHMVFDSVYSYVHYGVFDSVGFRIHEGVVTLHGSVRQPWRKKEIGERVARLEGVREVHNDIRVQPVSSFDDRLRAQLYGEIYGDALFSRFAHSTSPPVRIVVEHGNITLTGIVGSAVEKAKLEAIARGTLAFRVDNQVEVEGRPGRAPQRSTS